jgi:hypothetical protein
MIGTSQGDSWSDGNNTFPNMTAIPSPCPIVPVAEDVELLLGPLAAFPQSTSSVWPQIFGYIEEPP